MDVSYSVGCSSRIRLVYESYPGERLSGPVTRLLMLTRASCSGGGGPPTVLTRMGMARGREGVAAPSEQPCMVPGWSDMETAVVR